MTQESEATSQPLKETEIADFLLEHPDFFERHLQLLGELHVPHPSGSGTISLLERQVATLRDQLAQYKNQLDGLVQVARENERLSRHLHALTLSLIEAGSFEDLLNTLQDELRTHFGADAVELLLFSGNDVNKAVNEGEPGPALFQDFLDKGKPRCGQLKQDQLVYLFGSQAGETGSVALVPILGQPNPGILAIGSRDPNRFHPGKGTEFLRRLGEVVGRALHVVTGPGT
ncbi:MAG: DUF484 family protein [Pseudomonadota bacterium]